MTKYDSKFERKLHEGVLKDFVYHPKTFEFQITEKYTPDFGKDIGGNHFYIESKGYIYTQRDARKFVEFRKTLPWNCELVFCFQDPLKELKWQTIRKDGSKMSHFQWCEWNNFRWYCDQSMFEFVYELNRMSKNESKK